MCRTIQPITLFAPLVAEAGQVPLPMQVLTPLLSAVTSTRLVSVRTRLASQLLAVVASVKGSRMPVGVVLVLAMSKSVNE